MRRACRLFALLLSMLVLGGNWLVLERDQLLAAMVGFSTVAFLMQGARIQQGVLRLLSIPIAVAAVTLIRSENVDYYSLLSRAVNFIASIMLLNMYLNERKTTLRDDLYFILKLMSYQALITSILGNFAPGLFHPAQSSVVATRTYQTIGYVFTFHMTPLDTFVRPDGLFFEPGVLQIYLCIYLYLALHEYDDWRQGALAMAGIVSTYSTSGSIVSLLVIAAYLVNKLRREGITKRTTIYIYATLVMSPLIGLYVSINLSEKFSGARESSYLARQSDFYTALNIISANPIIGVGFTKEEYLKAAVSARWASPLFPIEVLYEEDTTNGVLSIIYSVGIPISTILFIGLYRQVFFREKMLFLMLLILSLLGQKLFLSNFILMLCFSGLVGKRWTEQLSVNVLSTRSELDYTCHTQRKLGDT